MGNMSLPAMLQQQEYEARWARAQQAIKQQAAESEAILAGVAALKRRAEIAEGKIFDALALMEDWDGVMFDQIRDVLDAK